MCKNVTFTYDTKTLNKTVNNNDIVEKNNSISVVKGYRLQSQTVYFVPLLIRGKKALGTCLFYEVNMYALQTCTTVQVIHFVYIQG